MPLLTTHESPTAADIVVIGAGINGLAISREAGSRGLRVVVIDQDDIAGRTSAISTRLIHGGLKYLERLELPLVLESIRERNVLLGTAPHLVLPYPMLIPFSRAASRPGWLLSCGLALHDALSIGKRLPRNSIVFGKQLRKQWPSIAAGGVRWGGLFQDSHVPLTERFAIELAIDASAHGVKFLTHTPVVELLTHGERVEGVVYTDRKTQERRELHARIVVNAAGPWVDSILDLAGEHPRQVGPTKGSHLIVDPFPGAPNTCVFFESPRDHRPMFVLPWWDGKYMLGTTDIPYSGSIDQVIADEGEIEYLLEATNHLIPEASLTADDVLWSYSGVRPLPFVADLTDPSSVTRDSEIVVHDGDLKGLVTIIGGKYTTHRALGEQVTRRIARELGMRVSGRSRTRTARFPGAPDGTVAEYRASFVRRSHLDVGIANRLVDVYGTLADRIERLAAEGPELRAVIDAESGAIAAEIVYAVEEEGAVTLADVLMRRTVIALGSDVGLSSAPRAAAILMSRGVWSPEHAAAEVERYREDVRRFLPRVLKEDTPHNEAC